MKIYRYVKAADSYFERLYGEKCNKICPLVPEFILELGEELNIIEDFKIDEVYFVSFEKRKIVPIKAEFFQDRDSIKIYYNEECLFDERFYVLLVDNTNKFIISLLPPGATTKKLKYKKLGLNMVINFKNINTEKQAIHSYKKSSVLFYMKIKEHFKEFEFDFISNVERMDNKKVKEV